MLANRAMRTSRWSMCRKTELLGSRETDGKLRVRRAGRLPRGTLPGVYFANRMTFNPAASASAICSVSNDTRASAPTSMEIAM